MVVPEAARAGPPGDPMKPGTLGLAHRLGNRMRPLVLATGILISLGLPVTYYGLEFTTLCRDARRSAREIAKRLPDPPGTADVRELVRADAVAQVRVFDGSGHPLAGYEHLEFPGSPWWDVHPPAGWATAVSPRREARTVQVVLSQQRLVGITLGLLILSTAAGVGIALVMYLYPVGVVRRIEGQIGDLLARQNSLLETGRLLASTLDLRGVLDRLTEIARSLPGIDVVRIWLRDEGTETLRLHSQAGARRGDVRQLVELGPGRGLTASVVENGRPVVLSDARSDPRLVNTEWFKTEGLVSFLGVPLGFADVQFGVLACMSRVPRQWSETEIALAETLGTLAAVAIRNARNYEEMTRRGDRLRRAADLARIVSGSLDLDAVLRQVIAAVVSLGPDRACVIRLVDHDAGGYRLAASGGTSSEHLVPLLPLGQGLTHVVAESRRPLLVADVSRDSRALPTTGRVLGARVYYGAPIEAGDALLGVLNVYFPENTPPTSDEREVIELFAGQAAMAIRNAQVFGESETRRRAAEALADIGRVLAQELEPTVVGQRIADSLCTLLGTQTSALYRLEPESGDLVALAVSGIARAAFSGGVVFPRGIGVSGLTVMARQPVVTADILNDARITLTPDLRDRIAQAGYGAVLTVPLMVKDRVIGALGAGDRTGRIFNPDEVRLAQAFANQAALALENARLFGQSEARRRAAEALADVSRILAQALDIDSIAERIAASACRLLGASSSALFRLDPDGGTLIALAVAGDPGPGYGVGAAFSSGTGTAGRAVQSRQPAVTLDVADDPEIALTPDWRNRLANEPDRAVLAVPLIAQDRVLGALAIRDRTGRAYEPNEIRLAQAFADQAVLALENARLYTETTRRQQEAQRAYEELSQAQAQLVRGETLRAMGELASGVAHHLNNLLAVVLGRLQLARAKEPPADLDRHLDLAERAALDGAEVVRRMRGFSRAQPAPDLMDVDLNRVAEEVIELTRPRWQDEAHIRGVTITTRLDPGAIPPVPGDLAALREVLMNFILNAIDALPQGGAITVRTWASPGGVHCEVADTGIGMSPEVQRRALEPFFTTKGFQSTGLGLSVNYGIIRRHGGELSIDSTADRGTRVAFRLPLATARDRGVAPDREAPPVTSPLRILVIDDEREVRNVIAEILAQQGHQVVEAAGGLDGLARLEREESFDLLLTDLGMPGMTGWDVARAAKARRPTLRVGLITGWGEQPAAKPADRAAADFVLAKPITLAGLRAALECVRPAASR
jgi:GAF domain-containing protein/anti-sigma regulatory factor (Ser/Thr protein kinase)